jgi:hypothetical protein
MDKARRISMDSLESRRLLSAAMPSFGGFAPHFPSSPPLADSGRTMQLGTLAAATVGNGAAIAAELDTLAGTTLAATTTVSLGNSNGVETYSVVVNGTGTHTVYTVDENAAPVTAPVQSTTTFGALPPPPAPVTTEIDNLVTATGVVAPTSTTVVNVSTPSSGPAVYTIQLAGTGKHGRGGITVSVDATGNVVGNITLPFAAFPSAITTALTAAAPAGSTAPADINVQTVDGVTLYSGTFKSTGVRTTVTINEAGVLTSPPGRSTVSTLPTAADTELTALATADGGTLPTTFTEYTQPNGTDVFSAQIALTGTTGGGKTYTYYVTLSVDQNGNATVPASDCSFGGFDGFGGFGAFGGFGGF